MYNFKNKIYNKYIIYLIKLNYINKNFFKKGLFKKRFLINKRKITSFLYIQEKFLIVQVFQ